MSDVKLLRPKTFCLEKFRNFKDVTIELGTKITVISGQNGVGKSNILSLIASGSGINKKSILGSNFQPEFNDFFNIDENEDYESYKLFLTYADGNGNEAFVKRLSFKDDRKTGRGIRIIPRTSNKNKVGITIKQAEESAKEEYNVGGAARVNIPTIFLSLSRLYPLGERKDSVEVTMCKKTTPYYQKKANEKYKQWYNSVIPNSIKAEANLSLIKKRECSRTSLHMDIIDTPTLSQSIGQDNLGHIISALVDIYMLSQEEDYLGALLCIDEIGVSLHPDTQVRLLDLLSKLATELKIQFVLTTHSLTIIKEMLSKEKKANNDYRVVYLKSPSLPSVTKNNTYELLKADMFGELSYKQPKVKLYFEDTVGKQVFVLLMKAFSDIYKDVTENNSDKMRNQSETYYITRVCEKVKSLKDMLGFEEKVKFIDTKLGCENLIQISKADEYFKRIIFILDGDARYKEPSQKPKVREYLDREYRPSDHQLNDREHTNNICFLPNYFAPESFIYRIINKISINRFDHASFWRGLDEYEETALYTSEKVLAMFSNLKTDFVNDDLKSIFKEPPESEVWNFVLKTDVISYYYSDFKTMGELLDFVEKLRKAFCMAYPIMLSNKYT